MNNMILMIRFLHSFFDIYHACIIEIQGLKDKVQGKVMYTDGEIQEFVWHYSDLNQVPTATQLLDILKEKKWLHKDKVIISKCDMIKYLKHINWNNDDINNTILFLFSLRISLVDNGEETDSFFIHF